MKKTRKPKWFLKNLEKTFKLFRTKLNKNNFESVNLFFQDESRFGLITKQKRVITAKGVKPIAKYKHSYQSKWLWGSFSPITGESFCMLTDTVCKDFFIEYLTDLSACNPLELKIVIIDNAAFHSTKDVKLPDNIILLPIPAYCPELNPAEKVWQYLKSKIAMKIYDTLDILESKIEHLVYQMDNKTIKSITGYEFYLKSFYNVFNV
ncbi:IS630 family transposase [Polaribacter batillariae]|uniref:IS630 family transposase n=1 Tax=Polaribacter batillariae TaxID=2808900 RepID=A0ABX7T1H5_9FLAO|nr:IS630 family transposase [Polaribacter batillariae]QTD39327.1 IS630 family transposase [Polaribacter batillariae]QTD39333.1 IS630 family transposase [Polaribacter batillariae]